MNMQKLTMWFIKSMKSYTRIASERLSWRELVGIWIAGPKYWELVRDTELDSYELAMRNCYNICKRHQEVSAKRGEAERAEAAMYISNSIHATMASM